MQNGSMGIQGGSAPSFGTPDASGVSPAASPANPLGLFPGLGNFAFPSSTDPLITSGLRNGVNAPPIGTLTGILTDPQFRVVIRALEQRQGVNLLSAPKVTTLSARQAQVKTVRVRYIVTDVDLSQTAAGGGTVAGGAVTTGG